MFLLVDSDDKLLISVYRLTLYSYHVRQSFKATGQSPVQTGKFLLDPSRTYSYQTRQGINNTVRLI